MENFIFCAVLSDQNSSSMELTQGKTIESQMTNWHKNLYSAASQISILICFFCRNAPNKQQTNRKTFEQPASSIL